MEMPGRYYFIALGFLKYIENDTRKKVAIEYKGSSKDSTFFDTYEVKGLEDIADETHVKMLEEILKQVKASNEYI